MLERKKNETNAFLAELKVRELKQHQNEIDFKARVEQIKRERLNLEAERQLFINEKEAWKFEKQKIAQIQPLGEIIQLNVGGNKEFEVRINTLCHVKGSALEAMFSGRHYLERTDNRIFIDRDPRAFRMMIDFIRNNGQLYED